MTTPVDPIAVAVRVGGVFDTLGVRHTIGGSIAASFAGEPRSTIDIDFVVALDRERVAPLVAALPDFYVAEEALYRAVESRGTANLIHQHSQLKVDLFVAGGTPLDDQQIARRLRVEVRPGQATSTRPRTCCCRSCAGIEWVAEYRIASGATSWASFGRSAIGWIAGTWL